MPVVRWEFYDPVDVETYVFEVNPREGGSPQFEKNVFYETTSAPEGKALVFEGRDKVQELEFSGVILTESHYTTFQTWYTKRHQIKVTDDLDREFWIYIKAFLPQRQRAKSHPWKHTYTIRATIIDWA